MTTATIVLWIIAAGLLLYARQRNDGSLQKGLDLAWVTTKRNTVLMVIAFIIVGYVNVLSPTELIQAWIGPNSGLRGLLLGEIIGMLLPGGPYVVFPLIAILYQSGAGLAPAVTIITSWSTRDSLHGLALYGHPLGDWVDHSAAGRVNNLNSIWITFAGDNKPRSYKDSTIRLTSPGPA